MAADTSEKPPQAGDVTPRQSISAAGRTITDSPGSSKAENTYEMIAMKSFDGSSEEKVDLQKLESQVVQKQPRNSDPFAHLDPQEAAILKRQVETPDVKVGLATLYRYATRIDLILLFIGSVCSIASGVIMPLMTIIFGSLQATFAGIFNGTVDRATFDAEMVRLVLYFVYLAIGMFVTVYISTVVFIYTGEHIAGKTREKYLEACMKQNIVSYLSSPSSSSQ